MADEVQPQSEGIDPSEAARALGKLGASKGGKARAAKLTPERRRAIAKKAVETRWAMERGEIAVFPKATHVGVLRIGETELPCAVLEDGARVFTQEGFLQAIGRAKKAPGVTQKPGHAEDEQVEQLPAFLSAANLKPFITEELLKSSRPILFRPLVQSPNSEKLVMGNKGLAKGYRVELLPLVCGVYLSARAAGVLTKSKQFGQMRIAAQCEILVRGLATVGIIALVDEATGYQYDRARRALEEILEEFISKELVKWAKMFPDDFYRELFRLRKWEYDPNSQRRPIYTAQLTIDLVYMRLAPGVLRELQRLTPRNEKGRLKHKLFQRLTEDIGHPKLRERLAALTDIAKGYDDWYSFYRHVQRAYPKYDETPFLDLKFTLPVEVDEDPEGE
jgi:P63C domain